jgi:ABC-type nitrate/sulfonate/bicarbonate transport system substrate-binding protein
MPGITPLWLRRGMLAVAAVTVLSVSAGCAFSSSGGGSGSSDSGALTVMTSSKNSLNFIGIAGNLHQWDGTGVSTKIIDGSSDTVSSALASGTADIGLQAGNTAALAIAKGLKAKIVGGMVLPWNQYLIARTKSGATKPEDLKGKKFGITSFGSGGDYATETMAKKLGWSASDYHLVKIGDPTALAAALKNGTIDAFYWSSGTAYQIQQQGYGKIIGSAVKYIGPTAFEVVLASDAVIKKHPEKVKALMQGYVKAVKAIKANPDEAVNVMVKDWGNEPAASKLAVHDLVPQMDMDGTIPASNLQGLADSVTYLSKGKVTLKDPSSVYQSWKDLS